MRYFCIIICCFCIFMCKPEKEGNLLSSFSKVKTGMTRDEVIELVGAPIDTTRGGGIWLRELYKIDEGWYMELFFDINKLVSMFIIDHHNEREFLLYQKEPFIKAEAPKMEMKQCPFSNLSKVKIGMTPDEIAELVGKPTDTEGPNITLARCKIAEGWYMELFFYSRINKLASMHIVDYHNERKFKLIDVDPSFPLEEPEMKKEMKLHSLSNFSEVKIGMKSYKAFKLVGDPTDTEGFNFVWNIYKIDEGWDIRLRNLGWITDMNIVGYPNELVFKLQPEKSSIKAEELEMEMKQYSLSNFSKVNIGMKYDEVVELAGKTTAWKDSSITWYLYKIDEGWYIKLFFDSNNTLFDMHIVDYPNEREFKLVRKSKTEIEVTAKSPLTKDKVRIEFDDTNMNTISRKTDKDIFNRRKEYTLLYDDVGGRSVIHNTYRENDFLITYDNKYYFSFRHLKTNLQYHYQYQYDYYFNFYTKNNSIFVEVNININGQNRIKFKKPMLEISLADKYRSNVQVDDTRMIYDMTELIDPKK